MGWIEQARRKQEAKLQALQDKAPRLQGQFGTDFHSAPGWREVGMEFSCIPDALHGWDETVVGNIRKIDSTFVPVKINWVFLSPSDTGNPQEKVFVRYGLARKVDDPHGELAPMNVLMPTKGKLPRPNKLVVIFQGPRKKEKYCDLPGEFVPLDGAVYQWFVDNYGQQDPEEVMTIIQAQREAHEKRKQKLQDEMDYVQKDLDKYTQKMLDRTSEIELRDYLLGDRRKGPTPYVHMRKQND